MGGGSFKPYQERALKESYARDCNPTVGENILLAHVTHLDKLQITRWFGRRRSEARGRGEELKTVNPEKTARVAHSMWCAYRRNPKEYAKALRSGRIDPTNGEEIGKGDAEDGSNDDTEEDEGVNAEGGGLVEQSDEDLEEGEVSNDEEFEEELSSEEVDEYDGNSVVFEKKPEEHSKNVREDFEEDADDEASVGDTEIEDSSDD